MNYILGIDESGKSDLMGSLVVSGALSNFSVDHLIIKDSKRTDFKKSELIINQLKDKVIFNCETADSELIDYYVFSKEKNLNILLIEKISDCCAYFLNKYPGIIEIYVDCPMNNEKKFNIFLTRAILERLENKELEFKLIVKHKADELYKIVALASLHAKVIKTKEFLKIKEKIKNEFFTEIKNGSVSDPLSISFSKNFPLNPYTRKSWKI